MKRVAVIGAGVSGLSVARSLTEQGHSVVVFEGASSPGGLIRCRDVHGATFHICGGHVFNTKDKAVDRWFWSKFDREREFTHARRNSAIHFDSVGYVGYPIENHVYQLGRDVLNAFLREIGKSKDADACNFEEFLLNRFGKTLYERYFRPYNQKIWQCPLSQIPLTWLDGKLPMPNAEEMIRANLERIEETRFVHSSFWYPRSGGSQLIANRLAEGLTVVCRRKIDRLTVMPEQRLLVDGSVFDAVVFCGNVKDLPEMLQGCDLGGVAAKIEGLKSHGTTVAFCSIEQNPYSWIYLPERHIDAHRIICTGNFSRSNNGAMDCTGSIEFTGHVSRDEVEHQLARVALHPTLLDYQWNEHSYPIQHSDTRELIAALKERLRGVNIHLVGRFAEWEYYNMDAAMASALRVVI